MSTSSAEPCVVHDLPWCGVCSGADTVPAALATGATIEAQYPGTCSHCSRRYGEGDLITYSSEAGGWCITAHTTTDTTVPPSLVRRSEEAIQAAQQQFRVEGW